MKNLKKEAYKLRMTPAEKNAMRAQIFGVPTQTPAASPYFVFNFQFLRVHSFAAMCMVLVVLVGGSTAYAAEGALPGDALYAVKINVNEVLSQALATSAGAKAKVHASLAERRVAEAQVLAAEGRLDATTSESLAVDFETHVEAAEAAAIVAEEEDAGVGRQVRATLAASLDANARILANLGEGSDEATRENTAMLSARVFARAESGDSARAALKSAPASAQMVEMALSLTVEDTTEVNVEGQGGLKAAASLEARANEVLSEARAAFSRARQSLAATTTTQIEEEFSAIETSMSLGSASLGVGATEQAGEDFTTALKRATTLKTLLEAHQKFNGTLIEPLLRQEDHNEVHGVEVEIILPVPPLRAQ